MPQRKVNETLPKFKGRNQIKTFRRIARDLTSKISSHRGVAGIVFIGGLVRGFADKFSDVDIVVLLTERDEHLRKQLYDLSASTQRRLGIDIDLEAHFLEDFKKQKWDEFDRWEFSRAEIVYDPEGVTRRVFEEKLTLPEGFWTRRVAVFAEHLKWYCCPPRDDVGTISESWVERGDLLSAHHCLNYGADLIVGIMFALNKEHLPAPKWRLFYSYSLKWQPKGFEKLIKDAMKTESFSVEDFNLRLKAIRNIWHNTLPKIEDETGLTMDQLSKYYVEKILGIRIQI